MKPISPVLEELLNDTRFLTIDMRKKIPQNRLSINTKEDASHSSQYGGILPLPFESPEGIILRSVPIKLTIGNPTSPSNQIPYPRCEYQIQLDHEFSFILGHGTLEGNIQEMHEAQVIVTDIVRLSLYHPSLAITRLSRGMQEARNTLINKIMEAHPSAFSLSTPSHVRQRKGALTEAEYKAEIAKLTVQIEELTAKLSYSNTTMSKMTSTSFVEGQSTSNLEELRNAHTVLQKEYANGKRSNAALIRSNTKLKADYSALELTLKSQKAESRLFKEELDRLRLQYAHLNNSSITRQKGLAEEISLYQKKIKELGSELQTATAASKNSLEQQQRQADNYALRIASLELRLAISDLRSCILKASYAANRLALQAPKSASNQETNSSTLELINPIQTPMAIVRTTPPSDQLAYLAKRFAKKLISYNGYDENDTILLGPSDSDEQKLFPFTTHFNLHSMNGEIQYIALTRASLNSHAPATVVRNYYQEKLPHYWAIGQECAHAKLNSMPASAVLFFQLLTLGKGSVASVDTIESIFGWTQKDLNLARRSNLLDDDMRRGVLKTSLLPFFQKTYGYFMEHRLELYHEFSKTGTRT